MSSMSEQNPTSPQDPLHYAPRYLREKPDGVRLSLVSETRDPADATERTDRVVTPASPSLDGRLEGAAFERLRHSLDPHVMREPPDFAHERDRRSVALKIAARFAAATGVAAVVALFFVNIVPASRPNASSSFVTAVQSMKPTTPPPAAVPAPAPAATPAAVEVKAEQADAKPESKPDNMPDVKPDLAEAKATPALSQFQSLLASGDASQAPGQVPAQAPKAEPAADRPLLQQFMQWNQKTAQPDKGQ